MRCYILCCCFVCVALLSGSSPALCAPTDPANISVSEQETPHEGAQKSASWRIVGSETVSRCVRALSLYDVRERWALYSRYNRILLNVARWRELGWAGPWAEAPWQAPYFLYHARSVKLHLALYQVDLHVAIDGRGDPYLVIELRSPHLFRFALSKSFRFPISTGSDLEIFTHEGLVSEPERQRLVEHFEVFLHRYLDPFLWEAEFWTLREKLAQVFSVLKSEPPEILKGSRLQHGDPSEALSRIVIDPVLLTSSSKEGRRVTDAVSVQVILETPRRIDDFSLEDLWNRELRETYVLVYFRKWRHDDGAALGKSETRFVGRLYPVQVLERPGKFEEICAWLRSRRTWDEGVPLL